MEIVKASQNKEISYIPVKACPVCGEHPVLRTESMGRPGGHGYPGHYEYLYRCEFCKLLSGSAWVHDIYDSPEKANNRAKSLWNEEVDRIQNHLRKQWVSKVLVENNVI